MKTQVIHTDRRTIIVRGEGTNWNIRVASYEGDCYSYWFNWLYAGDLDDSIAEAKRQLERMHFGSVAEIIAINPGEWERETDIDERHWWEISAYPEGCYPDNNYDCWDVEVEQFYCDRTSVEYYRFVGTKQEALDHFAGFNRKVTVTPTTYEAWEAEDYAESWWLYEDVTDSDIDEYAEALTERYTEDDNYLPF
jgi:DNA-binding XRE family transcriptional regulator